MLTIETAHEPENNSSSAWENMVKLIDRELGKDEETPSPYKIELMQTRLLTMLEGQYS